ncbi:MAG TPA: hypothetical protein VMG32_12710 [Anaeromyxobacteraceae bacterium]|nr:hypothetical protein [Anaeromyxobacteraceae bacterium]
MRTKTSLALLALLALASGRARADDLTTGSGTGRNAATPPATKSDGPAYELAHLPAKDLPLTPPHGMLGAPGGGGDAEGPTRLGAHSESPAVPSYGEEVSEPDRWRSGDLARSPSSADVRAARQEQAPDLEWASGSESPAKGQK